MRERNHVNLWRYLQAKLDADTEILNDKAAQPGGHVASRHSTANAIADMADAKIAATKVALEAAGYTVKPPTGFVVEATLPSHPTAAVLKPGDVIVTADGKPVVDDERSHAGDRRRTSRATTVTLGIVRDGKPKTVRVGLSTTDDRARRSSASRASRTTTSR